MSARPAFLASMATYVAVTCLMGRHVLGALGTSIASDPGDPVLNAAILAWNAGHVPWTEAWFQFPIFHPTANTLTFSEHLLGVSVVANPIYWLTGNAFAAYNVTLLLSYPLCGLAMYVLIWRLTRSPGAAFLAGIAFAFAPYRASQLPHIQMLVSYWAPLALLGLHAFVESPGRPLAEPALHAGRERNGTRQTRRFWLALFAICWMLQGAANGYLLVYFSVLIGLWALWFLAAQRRWRELALVVGTAALAALPLAPILYRYLTTQRALGLSRNLGEIASFGADIASPLCAPATLTFWGWLRVACGQEGELFAGAALITLCMASVARLTRLTRPTDDAGPARRRASEETRASGEVRERRRLDRSIAVVRRGAFAIALIYLLIAMSVLLIGPWRLTLGVARASVSSAAKPLSVALALLLIVLILSPRSWRTVQRGSTATFYLAAALVCWILSWGPFPRLFGAEVLYQAPFAWLLQLPGVSGLRVPARFWLMTVLCLVTFMGIVVAALLARCSRRASAAIVTLAACGLLADGWTTIPAAPAPRGIGDDAALRGTAVMVLPIGDLRRDIAASYHAVSGGWRSINGYSGYEPGYYEALRTLSLAHDAALFAPFRDREDLQVVVDEKDTETTALVSRQPGVQLVAASDGWRRYRLPRLAREDRSQPVLGRRIAATAIDASCSPEGLAHATDGDLDTRWVCGTQATDHEITFDLGTISDIGAVVHGLGTLGADFPRILLVETSVDRVAWQRAWEGSPASAVLRASMNDPRATRVVLPFAPRPARYVRLRQVGRHDILYWSIAELEVWSGRR